MYFKDPAEAIRAYEVLGDFLGTIAAYSGQDECQVIDCAALQP